MFNTIIRFFLILTSLSINLMLNGQHHCNTDIAQAIYLEQNPENIKIVQAQEQQLTDYRIQNSDYRTLISIPVVVHVIYHESRDSFSHESILAQIEQLNLDFNALNSNLNKVPSIFKKDIADVGFKFCLAYENEYQVSELGIEQKSTQTINLGDQKDGQNRSVVKYEILDGYDSWNTDSFVNIWVVDFEFISGEASFPGMIGHVEDGIMIDYDYFGSQNRTLTHEMGHYLNLKHLWGTDENCNNDDLVSDTPEQGNAYYDCPIHPQISCESADMFMNFMDYSNDDCVAFFTNGQKERMLKTLLLFRQDIWGLGYSCRTKGVEFDLVNDLKIWNNENYLEIVFGIVPSDKVSLAIYDIGGRFILKNEFIANDAVQLPISSLPNGMYFLAFNYKDQIVTKKIVIVR